jgi:hypothetical protein
MMKVEVWGQTVKVGLESVFDSGESHFLKGFTTIGPCWEDSADTRAAPRERRPTKQRRFEALKRNWPPSSNEGAWRRAPILPSLFQSGQSGRFAVLA